MWACETYYTQAVRSGMMIILRRSTTSSPVAAPASIVWQQQDKQIKLQQQPIHPFLSILARQPPDATSQASYAILFKVAESSL